MTTDEMPASTPTDPLPPLGPAGSAAEEIHQGYDLEAGVLSRAREWIDLLPWLRLLRVLRAAGSPPLLLVTAVVFGLWMIGHRTIAADAELPALSVSVDQNVSVLTEYVRALVPTSLLDSPDVNWRSILVIIWSIFIWTPLAMLLVRQGALLTAGRSLAPFGPGIAMAVRRSPAGWFAAVIPFACILPAVAMIVVVGWLASWFVGVQSLQLISAMLIAVLAVPCGLLAFGANVAIPISWAALMNEQNADPLDALSRGYEYLLRRPAQLLAYAGMSLLLMGMIGLLAAAVAWSANGVVGASLSLIDGAEPIQSATATVLWRFPVVVVLVLLWSSIGGVYLLLRYDAGSQEVEDLWQPPPADRPSLPDLPE